MPRKEVEIRDHFNRKPQPKLLRRLADYIETVRSDRFDMDYFCGTARCAFGHAPSIPAIGKLVKIVTKTGAFGDRYKVMELVSSKAEVALKEFCTYDSPFERAAYVFGITIDESNTVFGGFNHDRKDVANDLRKLASKYDGKPADLRHAAI